jgi:hypothetical protein
LGWYCRLKRVLARFLLILAGFHPILRGWFCPVGVQVVDNPGEANLGEGSEFKDVRYLAQALGIGQEERMNTEAVFVAVEQAGHEWVPDSWRVCPSGAW